MESRTTNRRQCPDCGVKLTRYEWSRLWWMSGMMSGRLVQPCVECGAKLRMSSMAVVSTISALGIIGVAIMYVIYQTSYLLFIALILLFVLFVAMLITRIEVVPSPVAPIEPPPERVGKKRL
jgi:hypothetical protein